MRDLRFAVLGAGFWTRFQLAGWAELTGARCVAIFNRTASKAQHLADEFNIAKVYDDCEQLLKQEPLDFVDIITANDTHEHFVSLAAEHRVHSICQKPFAESVEQARRMLARCHEAKVQLEIHENFRWQHAIRQFKRQLDAGEIGRVTRARVQFCSSFPVFDNQPFLAELPRFMLTDVGTHILDTARFLFGEARSVYCTTQRINPKIKGEDMATAVIKTQAGATVLCEMSYASITENERFPQTFIHAEGSEGSLELGQDFWIRRTTRDGTLAKRHAPPRYDWADPAYDCVHASIVDCNRDMLQAMQTGSPSQTSGADNLKTLELVEACYASAENNEVVSID